MVIVCTVLLKVMWKKDFFLLTDVPSFVSVNEKVYNSTYSESLMAGLSMTCDSAPYVCLKHTFTNLFSGDECWL